MSSLSSRMDAAFSVDILGSLSARAVTPRDRLGNAAQEHDTPSRTARLASTLAMPHQVTSLASTYVKTPVLVGKTRQLESLTNRSLLISLAASMRCSSPSTRAEGKLRRNRRRGDRPVPVLRAAAEPHIRSELPVRPVAQRLPESLFVWGVIMNNISWIPASIRSESADGHQLLGDASHQGMETGVRPVGE